MNKKIIGSISVGTVFVVLTGMLIFKTEQYKDLESEYDYTVQYNHNYQLELNGMIDNLVNQVDTYEYDYDKLQKRHKAVQKSNKELKDQLFSKDKKIKQLEQKIKEYQTSEEESKAPLGGFKKVNKKTSSVKSSYTASERALLEKLVQCEAGGESTKGKIAVVNVVLNRVRSDKFPDSITAVIKQQGQFQPVGNGAIYSAKPTKSTKEAVRRALEGEKVVADNIKFFWAKWVRDDHDIWKHLEPVQTIGVHHFATDWIN
jgi:N-acetylmuramoyl-L-alanine amidase